MTEQQFTKFIDEFVKNFRALTPIDSGNLRYNAVQFRFTSPNRCVVYIDESIGPYMPFTDKPWLSPKWKGKKNPNEGWFEQAVESALAKTTKTMKGKVNKR